MSDDCRKAFEEWAKSIRNNVEGDQGFIYSAWAVWQSAWNHRPAVSVVPGVDMLLAVVQEYRGDPRIAKAIQALLTAQAPVSGVTVSNENVPRFQRNSWGEIEYVTLDDDLERTVRLELEHDCAVRLLAELGALLTTAQGEVKPEGILFQHGETGRTTFVFPEEADEFASANPRWSKVGPLYRHPATPAPTDGDKVKLDDNEKE